MTKYESFWENCDRSIISKPVWLQFMGIFLLLPHSQHIKWECGASSSISFEMNMKGMQKEFGVLNVYLLKNATFYRRLCLVNTLFIESFLLEESGKDLHKGKKCNVYSNTTFMYSPVIFTIWWLFYSMCFHSFGQP